MRILYLLLLLPLASCFDLKEEVWLQPNGSGRFRLIADFSAHRAIIHELLYAADGAPYPTFGKERPLQELEQVWKEGADDLNTLKGISNAKEIFDRDSLLVGISFDFEDIQALNLALALHDSGENGFQPAYSFQKGRFTKNNVFSFYKLIEKLQPSAENLSEESLEMQKKAIFAQLRYSCSLEVAGKVKKSSNKAYIRQGKSRMQLQPLLVSAIKAGSVHIGNEVRFK